MTNSGKVCVVIPSWNGVELIGDCLISLKEQALKPHIIVVDNGSVDGSVGYINDNFPMVEIVQLTKNQGFTGGVNAGIKHALKGNFEYIALLNNDAKAEVKWLKQLVEAGNKYPEVGIITGTIMTWDGKHIDSTGEQYTNWNLSFPRDRDIETVKVKRETGFVFGASGGASLYRVAMLKDIGLFDDGFFAYYEDVDISFRAQLAGWEVLYEPSAKTYHKTGSTSVKIKGFTTYQTFKNLPLLFWKNVPISLLPGLLIRFKLAYLLFYLSAIFSGRGWPATKGVLRMFTLLPGTLSKRRKIQKNRKVSNDYIRSILVYDLPPNAHNLRRLRSILTFGRR